MQTARILLTILLLLGGNAMAAPIPSEIKSVVVFIYVEVAPGQSVPNGTGFFVGLEDPGRKGSFAVYLVTAKHVLQKDGKQTFHDKMFVRLNRRDGSSSSVELPIRIKGKNQTVSVSRDQSVDLAAIPFAPDQTLFDYKFLPSDMLTRKEDFKALEIREGSDVFFTGLLTVYPGAKKNYPVVRFGKVALVTDEKIDLDGRATELYLIEAGSYGGNSGSPVFFYLGSDRNPGSLVVGPPVVKLAGVMKGSLLDAKEIAFVETKKTAVSLSNLGIAAVIPAYKVHELLHESEVSKKRGF